MTAPQVAAHAGAPTAGGTAPPSKTMLPVPPRAAGAADAKDQTPSTATPASSAPALSPRETLGQETPTSYGLARRCRVPPGTHVNVYGRPDARSPAISSLKAGALVYTSGATELRDEGRWVQIVLPIGVPGWVVAESSAGATGLFMDEAGGRHGDGACPRKLQASLRAHATAMLRLTLAPDPEGAAGQPPVDPGMREVTHLRMRGHNGYLWSPSGDGGPGGRLPLLVVLHGAGKGGWDFGQMARGYEAVANRWNVHVLVPAALEHTWDFICEGQRKDTDFIQSAISYARQIRAVDSSRIAVMGVSDGGSMGLSLALVNPRIFEAALIQAAGFYHDPVGTCPQESQKPRVWLEYGTHDPVFSFEGTAKVVRDRLVETGHEVKFHAVEGGGHKARPQFVDDALQFWLGHPPPQGC